MTVVTYVAKMKEEAKVANLSIPTTGLVTQMQFGALKAVGTHNYLNAAVAAFSVLGLDVGIDADSIEATIEALCPPPHRMQISKHILVEVALMNHGQYNIKIRYISLYRKLVFKLQSTIELMF